MSYGTAPDLSGLPGVHIEVKRCEQQRIYQWMAQARLDAKKFRDGLPAVFWRSNCRPWLVIMDMNDFITLYKRAESAKNGL